MVDVLGGVFGVGDGETTGVDVGFCRVSHAIFTWTSSIMSQAMTWLPTWKTPILTRERSFVATSGIERVTIHLSQMLMLNSLHCVSLVPSV